MTLNLRSGNFELKKNYKNMILTKNVTPTWVKCDRCNKTFVIRPFEYRYAPMCHHCKTFQTGCDECAEKGCIRCGKPLSEIIY